MTANSDIILLVDADHAARQQMKDSLSREGYALVEADSGEQGLEIFAVKHPVLVILEIVLPGIDGFEVCRRLRAASDVPIIIVSSHDDEVDKVVGLELGADDYVTKPFGSRELTARVRAMLRRAVISHQAATQKQQLEFPGLHLDMANRSAKIYGEPQHLTPKEFELLFFLASQPQRVFTREEIIEAVWKYQPISGDLRTVDTHVKRLRQKLEESFDVPWHLATVWGVGYKFEPGQ
ncbi:MAG: response regulator transcription factor [candidate division WS1 bacterium]|jgi:DNA-binding response OmpR family regulator|nr:response regulator transcription factor [candidate division WS1 bacterium]